ncbi:MAG TPA: HU family DNA-binding protein [Candidatus Hydrogenedentes bacterium]|nr:HU family DNA-binding protein [Candidatus Hydrogenedentota bacterium]
MPSARHPARGFGVYFCPRSPRRGRNPQTGESMMITERHMISFRPSRKLREELNV